MSLRVAFFIGVALLTICCEGPAGQRSAPIPLWPGVAPGDPAAPGPEQDTTKPTDQLIAGKSVIRLGNVYTPTMTVYSPPADKNNGTAVLVCPGGGYHILAMDLEGTEICEWLNSLGVTGILLKYRVPGRPGRERHAAPLQDAQRALSLVRHRAKTLGINPGRVGALGFSAGAHLAALLSVGHARSYPQVDDADASAPRSDFAVLIYPAYLTLKDQGDKINPDVAVNAGTPPTFLAMSQDDPVRVETALFYAAALHQHKVPFELHVYPSGGHGYGLRPSKDLVTTWPQRAEDWLRSRGWLQK